jgi:Na+/proline symporter
MVEYSNYSWMSAAPRLTQELPGSYETYNLMWFTIFVSTILVVVGGASGGGGYMAQRYLAARDEREAGLTALFWTVLLALRWPLVVSFAILGIHLGIERGVPIENPESVLPTVLMEVIPPGLRGLLIACFLAAFMSTLSSFINATSAYWSNDIYGPFINKNATPKEKVFQGRLSSVVIVGLGVGLSYTLEQINTVWGFLTAALATGLGIPLLFRWYWWRFNGYGFSGGVAFGAIGGAIAIFLRMTADISPDSILHFMLNNDLVFFLVNLIWTGSACIAFSLMTPATDEAVLRNFYETTKPFGIWGRVRDNLSAVEAAAIKKENQQEILSAILAMPWQLCLFLVPMTLILKEWGQFTVLLIIVGILSAGLYFLWYKPLEERARNER